MSAPWRILPVNGFFGWFRDLADQVPRGLEIQLISGFRNARNELFLLYLQNIRFIC